MRKPMITLAVAALVTLGIGAGYASATDDGDGSTTTTQTAGPTVEQPADMDAMHAEMHAAMSDSVPAHVLAACGANHLAMSEAMETMSGMDMEDMGMAGMDMRAMGGTKTMPMGGDGGHAGHHSAE